MQLRIRLKNMRGFMVAAFALATLSSCTTQVEVKKDDLTARNLTQAGDVELYPDDRPSIPNGKVPWTQQNCASCHGATGSGGSAAVDLSDKDLMRKQKPIDQFMIISYGKGEYVGKDGVNVPVKDHPAMHDKLTKRQMWDLTFYTRSLAIPELPDTTIAAITPVYGSNCMVCHGTKGKGDGPLHHNLEPQPANFSNFARFYDRTDDILYDHIANGIKWEGMPNFLGKEDKKKNIKFDKDYIWQLVQYVRNFHSTNEATIAQEPAAPAKADSAKSSN